MYWLIPVIIFLCIQYGWLYGTALALVTLNPFIVAGALLVGGLSDGLRRRVRLLRETVAVQAVELATTQEQLSVAVTANASLKGALAAREAGLATLFEASRRLSEGEPVEEVVKDSLRADQCTVFTLEEAAADALVAEAVRRKEVVTIRDYSALRLMAAPIMDPVSGQCLGAVSVDSMPFVQFTQASAALLEAIASLAGRSMASGVLGSVWEWLGRDHFWRVLRSMWAGVSSGTAQPFSVITVSYGELGAVGERALSLLFAAVLRDSDVRGRLGPGRVGLAVLGGASEALVSELSASLRFLPLWLDKVGAIEVGVRHSSEVASVEELVGSLTRVALDGGVPSERHVALKALLTRGDMAAAAEQFSVVRLMS